MKNQEEFDEKDNVAKYGDKSDDVIARAFRDGDDNGIYWTGYNIKKYVGRFMSKGSKKSRNMADLYKSRDYLNRLIEEMEKRQSNE